MIVFQNIILREAKRNNVTYKPHGLRALGRFAGGTNIDITADAVAITKSVLAELQDNAAGKMDIDGEEKRSSK